MAKASTRRRLARLSFEDGEIIVTPADRSIFLISAEKATEACRAAVQADERLDAFETELLRPLHAWCMSHEDKVRACYVAYPKGPIKVFIVTQSPAFDFDLGEKIAELELELSKAWHVGVMQLPHADEKSLATFFNPDGALEVYAKRRPASKKSGA